MIPMLAPVVLFVYNRPWHTRQTLEALHANPLSDQSELIIFLDGPKSDASPIELEKIHEVRAIVQEKSWCKSVKLIKSETNLGLAHSIISGVTEIVNQYGKIIVLEDDVFTSPGFLKYMNEALDLYEKEEQVMHISGYMFPVKGKLPPTFFYNTASCWGWATWRNRWIHLRDDAQTLFREIYHAHRLKEFNLDNTADFGKQLQDNISGSKETWAIKWYASFFLKNGLALHPYPSLTNNIGHDRTGQHCASSSVFQWDELAHEIPVERISLKESPKARRLMKLFYRNLHSPAKDFKSFLRTHIPFRVRKTIMFLVSSKARKNYFSNKKRIQEIERIKRIPRYIRSQTGLLEFPLWFNDSASFLFMYREIFEKEIYHFTTDSANPYIIDCGSNIGLTIIYFKKLYPHSEIVAFEPDHKAFATLQENIGLSGLGGITLHQKALWNSETILDFSPDGSDGGKIALNQERHNPQRIETVRLKEFLRGKPVDLLKMDIEGSEVAVINDCREELHNVKRVFIEYHSFTGQPQDLDNILRILKDAGFRYIITNPGLTSENPFDKVITDAGMDMQFNIYGIRQD
jgi:FkbM family methyltransferase